ncbi:hypothetical protein MMC31_006806 [Peltigera leucophlebia]|nr:hypothetical protein [Peltigera leucophlebia]
MAPGPPQEKPLHELLTKSLVDIYIGSESTHWVLHEKLLCHHSPFFASKFYTKAKPSASSKSFGLPDTEDFPFELLVGWLYSSALRFPEEEKDIGPLLDLYFLSEQLQIQKLSDEIVEIVRAYYHTNGAYPGLRRVQYVYANTEEDNPMREMMVGSIARFLTLGDAIPLHWERALKKNGQLAVDIIRSIQEWHLEERSVPDAREMSLERGRRENAVGFSQVDNGHHINEEGETLSDIKEEEVDDDDHERRDDGDKKAKTNGITNGTPNGITNGA